MENPWVRMGRGGEINGFIGNKGSELMDDEW